MTKKNKNPEVRFRGFTEDWEKVQLDDITTKIGDGIHGTPEYINDGGVFFINGNNLKSGRIQVNESTNQVSESQMRENDRLLNSNTILLSINGTIGSIAKYHGEKVMLGKSVAYLNLRNIDKEYIYSIFQSPFVQDYFSNNLTGSTIKNLGLKTIRETEISAPSIKEQKQIGAFFQNLDRLIRLHQKKYNKLVILKKAMLIKMFPENGAVMPELRFKGFTEDWKEKELSKIASNISDGNWIESNHVFEEGEYRIIQTGNLGLGKFLDKSNHAKYFHQKDFDEVRGNEIFTGDILISRLAEPAGRTIILPSTGYRMVTAVDVTIIRPDDNSYDAYFLMTQLNTANILKVINKNVSGTSHKRISRKKLEKTKLILPNVEEQQKIGEYFNNLDNQIALNQTQLEKLNNIKKACFSKMFVSQD
jgi:type I restriction enzyme S subunit